MSINLGKDKIDRLQYDPSAKEAVKTNLFYNGPGEFLVKSIANVLSIDPVWKNIFGEFIDPYLRMDYQIRNLPALRIYNEVGQKESESWFVEGDIKVDILFPAILRRTETQQIQDTLTSALMQQFRRPEFFKSLCEKVPGLNELGKRFSFDKSLGFQFEENEVPLTQIVLNFRLDLRVWDDYLEQTDRTKDSPYEKVLGDLKRIRSEIEGLNEDETVNVAVSLDQKV